MKIETNWGGYWMLSKVFPIKYRIEINQEQVGKDEIAFPHS